MTEFTEFEKRFIATGLILAKDYLSIDANNSDLQFALTIATAKVVEKLGLDKEFGRACAETAGFAEVIRAAALRAKEDK